MSDKAAVAESESAQPADWPMLKAPRAKETLFVETPEQLAEAVELLAAGSGPFGVDAERSSGFKYSQRAYLIQVNRRDSPIFLIDPWAIAPAVSAEPFAELAAVLSTDTWILHAATQDLACLAELGLKPTKLFDTELGSRIAGLEKVGLGAVVEFFLRVKLAKEHSAVDWSIRPLQNDWLIYAALDVDVLQDLMDALSQHLGAQGKTAWAAEEFEHLLGFKPKPANPEKWRSMTGLNEVKDAVGLAIARELWTAREALAIRLDVSPGRLVPDASLSAVAKLKPRSKPELASQKSFYGRASRTYLDTWWAALSEGLKTRDLPPLRLPATGIPNHRSWPNKFPEADGRLKLVREVLTNLAKANNLPVENLLSPDLGRQLAWEPPTPPSAEAVSEHLTRLGARIGRSPLWHPTCRRLYRCRLPHQKILKISAAVLAKWV